jgi:hypothetical protein
MPRSFRALLPAEIRSRLEIYACGSMLSWAFSLLRIHVPASRGPVARPTPRARDRTLRFDPVTPGRGETREVDLDEINRHPKSFHQDLSPDSPDDSRVPSDCSDWK